MALATLICSIISASVAIFNAVITMKNSIIDVATHSTYENDGKRAFLRISVKNNSDTSIKITNLVVETDKGILDTTEGTVNFSPFDGPYALIGHDTIRYAYCVPIHESVKKITLSFSKRISLLSYKKVIFLD
ncbi:hypothetical protein [Limosilactobacillus vaginalis]|uniref:hypothetical protein n=1 Tax=Limosilactobacillus vaginalis TaxID=1633 RepID=UPI00373553C6